MTKDLRYESVKRSKLKNSFNKNRYHVNWYKYKSQRDYCVNLLRKTKSNISKIMSKIQQTIKLSGRPLNLISAINDQDQEKKTLLRKRKL